MAARGVMPSIVPGELVFFRAIADRLPQRAVRVVLSVVPRVDGSWNVHTLLSSDVKKLPIEAFAAGACR